MIGTGDFYKRTTERGTRSIRKRSERYCTEVAAIIESSGVCGGSGTGVYEKEKRVTAADTPEGEGVKHPGERGKMF